MATVPERLSDLIDRLLERNCSNNELLEQHAPPAPERHSEGGTVPERRTMTLEELPVAEREISERIVGEFMERIRGHQRLLALRWNIQVSSEMRRTEAILVTHATMVGTAYTGETFTVNMDMNMSGGPFNCMDREDYVRMAGSRLADGMAQGAIENQWQAPQLPESQQQAEFHGMDVIGFDAQLTEQRVLRELGVDEHIVSTTPIQDRIVEFEETAYDGKLVRHLPGHPPSFDPPLVNILDRLHRKAKAAFKESPAAKRKRLRKKNVKMSTSLQSARRMRIRKDD